MAGVAGIAVRGAGKALLKRRKVVGGLKERIRPKSFTPGVKGKGPALATKPADKYTKVLKRPEAVKIPSIKKTTRDIGKGAIIAGVAYAAGKAKATKEAKAKDTKEKLQKSAKEHEKKTKEKREKCGKHHG